MNKSIICIETSTDVCSMALYENKKISLLKEDNTKKHSQLLAPFLDSIIKECNFKIMNLDAIAISIGPGSYTGLRIGLSFAKGIAFSINKPIITVDTFDGINLEIDDSDYCIITRGFGEYYFIQEYNKGKKKGKIKFDTIDKYQNKKIYGYGISDGYEGLNFVEICPSAKNIGLMAIEHFDKNIYNDIELLEPNYVKHIRYKKNKNIRI